MKTSVSSTEFYEALRTLIPSIPDPKNVRKLSVVLEAGEAARVEIESWTGELGQVATSKYELKERE